MLAAEVERGLPDTGPAAALDLTALSESISLVQGLSDAEVDALDLGSALPDTQS